MGEVAEASGQVLATATQTEARNCKFHVDDHHWSLSNGFFVNHSRYYDSGYVKFYIDTGYRSYTVRKLETHGDVGSRFGLRIIQGDTVGNRGGHPERRYRIRTGVVLYPVERRCEIRKHADDLRPECEFDGELYVLSSSGHRNVELE